MNTATHTHHESQAASEALVNSHFAAASHAASDAGRAVARDLVLAAHIITAAFLSNHKLCVAGLGVAAIDAAYVVARLSGELEQSRPALPAVFISGDAALSAEPSIDARGARQIRAIGNPGDVLLIVCCGDHAISIADWAAAAHEREMRVAVIARAIDFEANDTQGIAVATTHGDLRIAIPEQRIIRMLELERVTLHALCDVIDSLLLGD
jgi:D-sedoheptulose 7-phosphate isomerase